MSKHQNKTSYDTAMPWLTRPGGIQLSDWPDDIVSPEMKKKEAKWAKAGEKFDFARPQPGDHFSRYRIKQNKDGPVFNSPPPIHVAEDLKLLEKNKRAFAARERQIHKAWIAHQEKAAIQGGENPNQARNPGEIPLGSKKQAPPRKAGTRSSQRIQEKTQAATQPTLPPPPLIVEESSQNLLARITESTPPAKSESKSNAKVTSAAATQPTQLTPPTLVVEESNLRSLPDQNLLQRILLPELPAKSKSHSHAKVGSVNDKKLDANSAADVTNKDSATLIKAATPIETKAATQSGGADRTSTMATTKASTRSATKKVTFKLGVESTPQPVITDEAIPKISSPSKDLKSSANVNGRKNSMRGAAGQKRQAADTLDEAPVKRPRIGRACDPCREKKTRCDGDKPCGACAKRGFNCVYGSEQSKPSDTPKGDKTHTHSNGDDPGIDSPAKKKPSDFKRRASVSEAFSIPEGVKSTKRKRGNDATDATNATAESRLNKRMKVASTIPQASAEQIDASSSNSGVKSPKRKQEPETDAPMTSSPIKKLKTDAKHKGVNEAGVAGQPRPNKNPGVAKTTLRITAGQAQQRARQQLHEDIERYMAERPSSSNATAKKRKISSDDEGTRVRTAKLQCHTRFIFEVLENSKLEAMQESIIKSLAQSASDFKPLQKIAHLVKRGNLSPQIIDLSVQEEAFHNRPSIKLVLPDHIKGFLVDDWENVTKNNQLVHLPHPKPVEVILQDYLAAEKPNREEGSTQMDILEETIAGLREYFDRALGRILLYRFERAQYAEQQSKWTGENNKEGPSTTYGAEHLSRLLVSLPELIAQTNMDQQSVGRLREEITKFTNWLGKNYATYWQKEYETPDAEYVASAKSG